MTNSTAVTGMSGSSAEWAIIPRTIDLDWSGVPLQWIHGDSFASMATNGLSYFLTVAEFAMCKLCNEALPYIEDEKLREDLKAFVRQEAMHARAHEEHMDRFMARYGIRNLPVGRRARFIMGNLLSRKPLGIAIPKQLEKSWLMVRAGFYAAAEHYTTGFSHYLLNHLRWEENGCDETMSSLLHWHAVEEIEHRTVMFDLYRALGGSLPLRAALMGVLLPGMLMALATAITEIGALNPAANPREKSFWQPGFWRAWQHSHKAGNVPALSWFFSHAMGFMRPDYNPANEASTEQAMAALKALGYVRTLAPSAVRAH